MAFDTQKTPDELQRDQTESANRGFEKDGGTKKAKSEANDGKAAAEVITMKSESKDGLTAKEDSYDLGKDFIGDSLKWGKEVASRKGPVQAGEEKRYEASCKEAQKTLETELSRIGNDRTIDTRERNKQIEQALKAYEDEIGSAYMKANPSVAKKAADQHAEETKTQESSKSEKKQRAEAEVSKDRMQEVLDARKAREQSRDTAVLAAIKYGQEAAKGGQEEALKSQQEALRLLA